MSSPNLFSILLPPARLLRHSVWRSCRSRRQVTALVLASAALRVPGMPPHGRMKLSLAMRIPAPPAALPLLRALSSVWPLFACFACGRDDLCIARPLRRSAGRRLASGAPLVRQRAQQRKANQHTRKRRRNGRRMGRTRPACCAVHRRSSAQRRRAAPGPRTARRSREEGQASTPRRMMSAA